ncbi:hypothetical protein WJX73_009193 [Symbiochloris irregularis]|uniref:F-box domain-containing protein n=1 Tax=Symbiochloris irregularis TaxID=706552 RepID=A0AAW1P1S0_9CHLO
MRQTTANKSAFPAWNCLPRELLAYIFKNLEQADSCRAESTCRTWHQVLADPQDPDLWGYVGLDLDVVPWYLWASEKALDEKSRSEYFLPLCRWLSRRAVGMTELELWTIKCKTCKAHSTEGHSTEGIPCEEHCCNSHPTLVAGGLAMLMTALSGHPLDVAISLQCSQDSVPSFWQPMLQQTFIEHVVRLHLRPKVEECSFIYICALTRLTSLHLRLEGVDFQKDSPAANGLASLHSLQDLSLKGSDTTSTLASLDLSALTGLSSLQLRKLKGCLVGNRLLQRAAAPDQAHQPVYCWFQASLQVMVCVQHALAERADAGEYVSARVGHSNDLVRASH